MTRSACVNTALNKFRAKLNINGLLEDAGVYESDGMASDTAVLRAATEIRDNLSKERTTIFDLVRNEAGIPKETERAPEATETTLPDVQEETQPEQPLQEDVTAQYVPQLQTVVDDETATSRRRAKAQEYIDLLASDLNATADDQTANAKLVSKFLASEVARAEDKAAELAGALPKIPENWTASGWFKSRYALGDKPATTRQAIANALRQWFITPEMMQAKVVIVDTLDQLSEGIRSRILGAQASKVGAGGTAFKPVDTESAEFKNWFGDSPTVTAAGAPQVLYTGTSKDADFTKFKMPKNGVWFTTDASVASGYAASNDSQGLKQVPGTWRMEPVNTSSRVIPAYVAIRKPYTLTVADFDKLNVQNYKKAQGVFFDTLRAQGYDGVDFGGGTWVVLGKPSQIKSATSNTGDFSDTNPDIRFSKAGDIQAFVLDGKAYMIAENIPAGAERAVFMHEVGAHIGLDEKTTKEAADRIKLWAHEAAETPERKAYDAAMARMESAQETSDAELVAYTLEEAVKAGVTPQAVAKGGTFKGLMTLQKLVDWFANYFMTKVKSMLGVQNIRGFSAQDLVDLTYGASREALASRLPAPKQQELQFSMAAINNAAERIGGPTMKQVVVDAAELLQTLPTNLSFLPDFVAKWEGKIPALRKWYNIMLDVQARSTELELRVDKVLEMARALDLDSQGRVDTFLHDSTMQQKWGYDPKFERTVVVDKEFEQRFEQLTKGERALVKAVFQHGENTMQLKREIVKKLGIKDEFTKRFKQLQGPYAPLRRFGQYMVEVKSPALVKAEAEDSGEKPEKLSEMKRDPNHYSLYFRDTKGAAVKLLDELLAGGKYDKNASYAGVRPIRPEDSDNMPMATLQKVMSAVKADTARTGAEAEVRAKMEQLVRDLWFRTAEDSMARQAQRQRKYIPGADESMIRAFAAQGKADAAFLANLEHGEKLNNAVYELANAAKNSNKVREFQPAVNAAIEHQKILMTYKETPIQDATVGFTSAWQLATSLGYHVTNATQPWVVTAPILAGHFGDWNGAIRHINAGYSIWNQMRRNDFDFSQLKDSGLQAALERATRHRLIDVGYVDDFNQFNRIDTHYQLLDRASLFTSRMIHKLREVSRKVERANRISAATAAYNMAIEHNYDQQKAEEFVIRVLEQTQGDSSALAAPLLLKKLPKVITQYRKYQLLIAGLYARNFRDAFWGESAEMKAIGRRTLGYMLMHTSVAAGALGLPMMNIAAPMLAAAFGDDDEPQDFETMVRDAMGDKWVADLILRGPLNALLGLDMSAKLGQDKVFDPLPFTDYELSRKGVTNIVMGIMGPAAGMASRMADGASLIADGNWYMGAEKFTPRGVEDALVAFRTANKGFQLKNGDVMVQPEDIGANSVALQMLGMPSAELKRFKWIQSRQIEITKFYKDAEQQAKKDYAEAVADGDSTGMSDAEDRWLDLQSGKDKFRQFFNDDPEELRSKPLKTLLAYPKQRAEREQKLQKSVPLEE